MDMQHVEARFAGRRVLVTGGLGFIGSNVARRLAAAGAHVAVVDNLQPSLGGNMANVADIKERLDIHVCSMEETNRLPKLVSGCDYIFNLAGQTSHQGSMDEPITDARLNCIAQLALLEACRLNAFAGKIVFSSTRQIYGRPDYLPVDEGHPIRPVDINGVHKQACEAYHQLYHSSHGIRSTIVRLTNTFGPGMRICDASQIFLGLWVRLALQARPFEVWGGQQLRDFTYVEDAVDALLMVALDDGTDGQVYNIPGGEQVKLIELADILTQLTGASHVVEAFPRTRALIDIGDFVTDGRKLVEKTGWSLKTSLRDGLERTLEYYRHNLHEYL